MFIRYLQMLFELLFNLKGKETINSHAIRPEFPFRLKSNFRMNEKHIELRKKNCLFNMSVRYTLQCTVIQAMNSKSNSFIT